MCSSDLFHSHDSSGATGGGTEQGVSAITPQAVAMGLQARAIEAQVNNTEADTALKMAQAATLRQLWAYGYIWDGNKREQSKSSTDIRTNPTGMEETNQRR